MPEPSLSVILDRLAAIAEEHHDEELKKWVALESRGYFAGNPYLTDTDVVPQYRGVGCEHRDEYGRPLVIKDPHLGFVNTIRLRHSVVELENFAESGNRELKIRDPATLRLLNEELNVPITESVFDIAGVRSVLAAIRDEAIGRAKKYVTRAELLKEDTIRRQGVSGKSGGPPVGPDNVTVDWLLKNVTVTGWGKLFALLFVVFLLGLYASGSAFIKNALRYVPGYHVEIVLPEKTAVRIEKQIDELVRAHNARLSTLQKGIIKEESEAALQFVDTIKHREAADRLRRLMEKENENFAKELKLLKALRE